MFKCAFKIDNIWLQACMLQTHFRIAVPLVWGSLMLTPMNYNFCQKLKEMVQAVARNIPIIGVA